MPRSPAAFGVAKWIFQDGHLSGVLNFEPQGFVDAWAPLFFGAMLSGVAMDYTLFLLSAAREHYDRTGDPQHAMRMALRTSGRVVVAAAGVMVAVFLTFALSGPLAPKEMGIILAVAVFLDALLHPPHPAARRAAHHRARRVAPSQVARQSAAGRRVHALMGAVTVGIQLVVGPLQRAPAGPSRSRRCRYACLGVLQRP